MIDSEGSVEIDDGENYEPIYLEEDKEFDEEYFNDSNSESDLKASIRLNSNASMTILVDSRAIYTTFDLLLVNKVREDINTNIGKLY